MLAKGDDNGCVFVTWYLVNDPRKVTVTYHRVELDSDQRVAVPFPLNPCMSCCVQKQMFLKTSTSMKIKKFQC